GKDSELVDNRIAEVFSDEVPDIMNVDNVSILSTADDTTKQVAPKTMINLVMGVVIGLIIALIIIFIKEMFDKRIKSETDVENELKIPVLGSIQKFNKGGIGIMAKKKRTISPLYVHDKPKSTVSEKFRGIRSNIMFSSAEKEIQSLLITSEQPKSGKSTVSANIAVTYAQAGYKT